MLLHLLRFSIFAHSPTLALVVGIVVVVVVQSAVRTRSPHAVRRRDSARRRRAPPRRRIAGLDLRFAGGITCLRINNADQQLHPSRHHSA